jgi:hypothetical protein
MAGIFINGVWSCGFDFDPTAAQIFTSTTGGTNGTSTSQLPFGTGFSWNTSGSVSKQFNTNLATVISGIRLYATSLPGTGSNNAILTVTDQIAGTLQVGLVLFNDGHVQFYRGSGTSNPIGSASAAGVISRQQWAFIETLVTISSTVGVVQCHINGTSLINSTGLNTQASANASVSEITYFDVSGGGGSFYDDWYMLDTTGASPLNTFLGNVQVAGVVPNANSAVGGRNAWTPTNPHNVNWENVSNLPLSATEYNADSTVNDFDMFRFPNTSASTVYFVNEWAALQLDAAGSRTVSLDCYSGGTDATGTAFTPSTTVTFTNQPYVVDPNTSSAWTVSGANAAELGVKVIS